MIRTWKIDKHVAKELYLSDHSSLDAITRQLPEGYYSTFRTYDGCMRVLGLSAHLKRLPDVGASLLRRNLMQLLEPFRPDEARVRVMLTYDGQLYISIEPLIPLPKTVYENGVRVVTTGIQRRNPRTKSTTFVAISADERRRIARTETFEALLVKKGMILEGMTSNFFYIIPEQNNKRMSQRAQTKREICTAQRDVLLGVTRRTVIRVARSQGLEVRFSPLKLDQLSAVTEAFITSSSRGIVPVIQIDDVTVGEGRVGKMTKQLSAAYETYVVQKAERI